MILTDVLKNIGGILTIDRKMCQNPRIMPQGGRGIHIDRCITNKLRGMDIVLKRALTIKILLQKFIYKYLMVQRLRQQNFSTLGNSCVAPLWGSLVVALITTLFGRISKLR